MKLVRAVELAQTVSLSRRLLKRGRRTAPSSSRVAYGEALFEKATRHAHSMCLLIRHLRRTPSPDVAGISLLARAVIEARNAFAYLIERGITDDEFNLRLWLLLLNHSIDAGQIYARLQQRDSRSMNEVAVRVSRATLRGNPVFGGFNEKQREQLLKGRTPYLRGRYKGRSPVERSVESALYNLFSHSTHSFSLSLPGVSGGGDRALTGPRSTFFLAVEISIMYLCDMAKGYKALRARATGELTGEELMLIEEAASGRHLNEWVAYLQNG